MADYTLVIQDTSQLHASDAPTLVVDLIVADASQLHTAQAPVLTLRQKRTTNIAVMVEYLQASNVRFSNVILMVEHKPYVHNPRILGPAVQNH